MERERNGKQPGCRRLRPFSSTSLIILRSLSLHALSLHSEVARFCAAFMASEVRGHAAFGHGPDRDVPTALAAAFHGMDAQLRQARPAPPAARLAATAAHLSPPLATPLALEAEEEEEEGGAGMAAVGDEDAAAAAPAQAPGASAGRAPGGGEDVAPAAAEAAPPPADDATTVREAAGPSPPSAPPPGAAPTPPAPPAVVAVPPAAASAWATATLAAAAAARTQAGCTALVAVLSGIDLWVANAGDSRAVLCGRGGRALPLSFDHKPGEPGEAARIRAAGGFVAAVGGVARVNGSLALSRAIGDLAYKDPARPPPAQVITAEPDVRHCVLSPGDAFLLLACDGVWDVLTSQGAVDVVRAALAAPGGSPSTAAHALVDACLSPDPRASRGAGCDNMTAAVVLLPTVDSE